MWVKWGWKRGENRGKRGAKDVKKWVRTEGEKGGNEREQTRCHIGGKRIGKKWVTCGGKGAKRGAKK